VTTSMRAYARMQSEIVPITLLVLPPTSFAERTIFPGRLAVASSLADVAGDNKIGAHDSRVRGHADPQTFTTESARQSSASRGKWSGITQQ